MSDLDKFDLRKKYEQKGSRVRDLKDLTKALQESPVTKAAKQTVAGFKSQWSGINDKGEVGMGKGTPGIYYNTVALPAMAGIVDDKYAPDFAVAADKKAGKIKEAVRKDMGIDEPKGALEHFAYAGGEMLGQAPIPGSLMAKIVGGVKKMGMAGKVAAAPIEYLSPTIDPKAINYGIGTAFGGTMGVVGEPSSEESVKKALGGLIQKYDTGGKVSKVKTFFSAVDKAIETLKQKKGTGEQILKQLETTPGVKREELESRAIKRKLEVTPKITQEDLLAFAKENKPAIPKRITLEKGKTKFHTWSKSKGENNYREILLQSEDDNIPSAALMRQRLNELLTSAPETEEAAKAVNMEIDSLLDKFRAPKEKFRSSHWDQPDVLAHYRVNDMIGPNGEKVLYVDEIQSDWHQVARDVRKAKIKSTLNAEDEKIYAQAAQEFLEKNGKANITSDKNKQEIKVIQNRLVRERKAELEKEIDENFGYKTPEDDEKLYRLNSEIERLRNSGMTLDDLKQYYQPGKIVPTSGGLSSSGSYDKVLSFNSGEDSPEYKKLYDEYYARNMSVGVGEEVADRNARKNALEQTKSKWSVTVVAVDKNTGLPLKGEQPRMHYTSPESYLIDQLRGEASVIDSKTPDAPFKKNWHELAVRDILDLAANEGYDKVAFSPGIDQVERYTNDLRRAVDKIEYLPTEDGGLVVQGIKGGNTVFMGKTIDGTFVGGNADGKTLSEVFGSSIAKQIEEEAPGLQETLKSNPQKVPEGVIEGDNLTIGGEGMKSFYDKRLPDYVKEYGRKEFKAPTGYMEIESRTYPKNFNIADVDAEINRMQNDDPTEVMELAHNHAATIAEHELASRGITRENTSPENFEEAFWEEIDNHTDAAHDQASLDVAIERLKRKAGKTEKQSLFSIDITPEMKEKITTQGQRLHGFVAPQLLPPVAAGAAGAEYLRQQQPAEPEVAPEPAPEEQPQASPEAPEAFQEGGKVGNMAKAAESLLRVLHGSPTKVRLEQGKDLDVTTEESYAMKRARDKMDNAGIQGPPVMNKFDIQAKKLLRFEEQYSPEDVALMRRYFSKLPEGQAMTGEEIYDAAGGKAYVLDGIAKAGGFAGYQRPAQPVTGSRNEGSWYRVTDQKALTRKARGGLMHLRRMT